MNDGRDGGLPEGVVIADPLDTAFPPIVRCDYCGTPQPRERVYHVIGDHHECVGCLRVEARTAAFNWWTEVVGIAIGVPLGAFLCFGVEWLLATNAIESPIVPAIGCLLNFAGLVLLYRSRKK